MSEALIQNKLFNIQKGSRIFVIPFSISQGDRITTTGIPCENDVDENSLEIREPFEAMFEDFDGKKIKMRTERFYCLTIHASEIKDIDILE